MPWQATSTLPKVGCRRLALRVMSLPRISPSAGLSVERLSSLVFSVGVGSFREETLGGNIPRWSRCVLGPESDCWLTDDCVDLLRFDHLVS